MIPLELRVTDERRVLRIKWRNGDVSLIPASRLRDGSRAASHIRAIVNGGDRALGDISLLGAEVIGSYAVRLIFSDGHDQGIYPWSYLREIADTKA